MIKVLEKIICGQKTTLKLAWNSVIDYSEILRHRDLDGVVRDLLMFNCEITRCPFLTLEDFITHSRIENSYFTDCDFTAGDSVELQKLASRPCLGNFALATVKDIDKQIDHLLDQRNKLKA